MKYYLIAGEASGDLHASNLMKSLKALDKEADFRFFGGDLMQSVGGTLVKHYRELAFMGFIPVLMNARTILKNLKFCKKEIQTYCPDVVILIDYPGFNLEIAQFVGEKLQIPVYYYISPKIWVWKEYRIKNIKKYVDKMLCILPFEVEFYQKHNYSVDYVGNPSVDAFENRENKNETFEKFTQLNYLSDKPIIALLAGSRKQEIKDNLPMMLKVVSTFPDYQAVIAGAPGIEPDHYNRFLENKSVSVVFGQTYRLLQQSKAALVTSGTATLETSLFRVPQVVCYKTPVGQIVSFIWDRFFKVKYISLVNLIAGKTVVKELFGKYFSFNSIKNELRLILNDEAYRKQMDNDYQQVIERLGKAGASEKAATIIYNSIRSY